jgi:membrane protease YdiL (CAAX protease family)
VDDRPGEAAPPFATAPISSAAPDPRPDPLSTYRALQVISILLVVGGFAAVWLGFIIAGPGGFDPERSLSIDRAVLVLAAVAGGGLAVVIGLVMNAVRALVVRQPLPPTRYRGPSIGVLLLLATIVSVIVSIAAAGDALAFQNGGEVSVGGALIILTATQAGLVAVAIGFVAIPKALDGGIRLLPPLRVGRSVLLGVVAALAAWIGVTLLSEILTRLLELAGREPQAGVVQEAVSRLDPTVLILAVVLVAPVAEELFFRGVVLNAWLREYGERRAVLGSAALFAAIHADIRSTDALIGSVVQVIPIFGLGIALALVCLRTRSLLAPMAMHASFNAISLTLALLARLNGWEIPT